MLFVPHIAVGALIGYSLGNPYLIIPLGLLSHFVLDFLPHWDPELVKDQDRSLQDIRFLNDDK